MPQKSNFKIEIPASDILSWLFPPSDTLSDRPQWIDAQRPDELSLSPRQALQWIKRLGLCLHRLGLQENDVVLVFSPNHIFMPVAYLGASGYGHVFSAVNPAYGVAETKYQIENTGAKLFLVEPTLAQVAVAAAEKAQFPKERIFLFSDEPCQTTLGLKDWRSVLPTVEEAQSYQWKRMSAEEARTRVAILNYSSGTTGLPKGVMVSHQNIIANAEQSIHMRRLHSASPSSLDPEFTKPNERWLGFLPMYHAYGQLWYVNIAYRLGIPVYYMRYFEYRDWLKHIQNHKITQVQAAPPIMVMLAKRPETDEYDLSSLQVIICGAAPLSRELQNEVMQKFGSGLTVLQGYGATELTCGQMIMPGNMKGDLSGSIGLVNPNSEVRLVDDDGNEVPDGERGEVYARGPNVTLGYWKNEKATRESYTEDGYWKTGDIGIRKNGWYWIVDRKKELIKVRGFQVAPAELEAALLENDNVADAAVTALKLEHEERPRAYVTLKEHAQGKISEDDIVKWLAGRVARHKQLTGGCKFVEAVPKSPSGKIQRVIMREWAANDAKTIKRGDTKAKL